MHFTKTYRQNLKYVNPAGVKLLGFAVFGEGDGNMAKILRENHNQTCRPVEENKTVLWLCVRLGLKEHYISRDYIQHYTSLNSNVSYWLLLLWERYWGVTN